MYFYEKNHVCLCRYVCIELWRAIFEEGDSRDPHTQKLLSTADRLRLQHCYEVVFRFPSLTRRMLHEDIVEHFHVRPLDKLREERMWLAAVPQDFKPVLWETREKALAGLAPHQISDILPVHYAFVYTVENGIQTTQRSPVKTSEFVSWSLQGLLDYLQVDVRLFVGRGMEFVSHPPGSWAIRHSSIPSTENSFVFALTLLRAERRAVSVS